MQTDTMLEFALSYTARGWSVFPIAPNAKVPAISRSKGGRGFHQATTEMDQIVRWWTEYTTANIGLATGDGLVVIDVDEYKGATVASWKLPPTLTAWTPHGGRHYYFSTTEALPGVVEGGLGSGICVKAAGGYVLLPPSRLEIDGHPQEYLWEDEAQPITVLPSRIASDIRTFRPQSDMLTASNSALAVPHGRIGDWGEKLLADAVSMSHLGAGDHVGYWLATQLQIVQKNGHDVDVEATLTAYAHAATLNERDPFTERDVNRWRESALHSRLYAVGEMPKRTGSAIHLVTHAEQPPDESPDEPPPEAPPAAVDGKGKSNKPPLIKNLSDAILDHGEHFAVDTDDGLLFVYRNGCYQPNGETVIRMWVRDLLLLWDQANKWSSTLAEEVIKYTRIGLPHLWDRPPMTTLNVQNGLLDIASRQIRDHSPSWLSTVQLPMIYDEDALCSAWDWLAQTILPADAQALPFELAAWLMVPYTALQKAVLLTGEGGNGKSRLLAGLRSFIGHENYSVLSLHDLDGDRFAPMMMYGKLANVCADLSSNDLVGTGKFKQIVDGAEAIRAERKYGHPVKFTPYCRMIFSANQPPKSPDNSQAFYDRWVVVPFPNDFRGSEEEIRPDEIDAWLAEPEQLSGLLNRALDAFPHVATHGLSVGLSMNEAHATFQETTDPFAIWLSRAAEYDVDEMTLCSDALRAWNSYREQKGGPNISSNSFTRMLRRRWPHLSRENRMVGGDRRDYYVGLRLIENEREGREKSAAQYGERWDQNL